MDIWIIVELGSVWLSYKYFFVYSTEHSGIADKIKTFLDLNQPDNDLTDGSSGDDDDEEDGFEHITEEVIEELNTD